jgi:hypothetical protein
VEKKIIFATWLLLTLLTASGLLIRRRSRIANWGLSQQEAAHVMLGTGSALSGIQVFYKIITEFEKLEPIVGNEGLIFMCIGGLTALWFGIAEIGGLLPPSKSKPKP